VDDRLARLAEHPGHAAAMQYVPRTPAARMFLHGVTVLAGGSALLTLRVPLATVVGALFALAGLAVIAVGVFFVRTPLERVLATVAAGLPGDSRFVTLERVDGVKRDYKTGTDVAARITAGDQGVAYLKAGFLLDFHILR
jgi:hypothetical protein